MTFKLLLSTAVWGEDYLEIFLEYTLKSLLKSNNLLNKQISKKSEYLIYTKNEHVNSIKNHRNFKSLKKKIKIYFFDINKFNKTNKYASLKTLQNSSLNYGYKNKFEYFSFIYPDSVFGDNHYATLLSKIKKGYKIVMCPGPLGIYENFVKSFKNKELNNKNLSKFIIKNLHPFYKGFVNNSRNSRLNIVENKDKNYQIYKCLDLHPAIISFSIKKLKVINTIDEDILKNNEVFLKDIDYLNYSSEGIIITLESYYTERAKITKNSFFNKLKNFDENTYDVIKYCDKDNLAYHVNHHLKGNFIVSEKKHKKYKKLINFDFKKEKILKNVLLYNFYKVNKKESITEQFIKFKNSNLEIKNELINKLNKKINERVKLDLEIERKYREEQAIIAANRLKNENLKIQLSASQRHYKQKKIESRYVAILHDENIFKLTIISFLIVFYNSLPKVLRSPIIMFKQKNRSNKFINKNLRLIRFLLMLPRKTVVKILFKRIV